MSFASEVRRELTSLKPETSDEELALMMAILQNSSGIIVSDRKLKLLISSYILNVIKEISQYLKKHYDTVDELKVKESNNLNDYKYYYLEVTNNVNQIINDFKLLEVDDYSLEYLELFTEEKQKAYLRGLFITHGSISDPRKDSYHFEIYCSNQSIVDIAKQIMSTIDVKGKTVKKGSGYLVYVKRAEDISKLLIFIGATQGMYNFEDIRIYRDFNNMANRITNCDIANERKCAAIAQKQLSAIEYIRNVNKFYDMPVRLQSIAELREMYPDSSNEELSQYSSNVFGKELSKSGISHCLRSLMDYYNTLINAKENK